MADAVPNGSNVDVIQNEAKPEARGGNLKQDSESLPKCSPRYHSTIIPHRVASGRAYISNMVTSQKTMLEHLRYVRTQLAREERQMMIMQAQIGYRKEIRSMPQRYEATIIRRRSIVDDFDDEEGED